MKGFDLYEQWRSCVFEVSGFTERSWDALEIWERRAWEEMHDRQQRERRRLSPDHPIWDQPERR
jgi:hypothetical protein